MNELAGTRALARLAFRADRIRFFAWTLGAAVVVISTASSFESLYKTVGERVDFATSVAGNATFELLYGPAFDLSTTGGLTAWRIGGGAAVIASLMSVFMVVRHTRAEEEAGRSELLGSTVIGRYAPLAAALLVMVLANVVVVLLITVGLIGLGSSALGSFALGLAVGLTGCFFGGVGAVTAQIATTGRGASGMGGAVLGIAFLLRAAGDVGDGTLSWASPIGWGQQMRPFAGERWWPAIMLAGGAVLLCVAAQALLVRRDQGSGLLADRPGPSTASPRLGSPWGLAWRLQRGVLLAWSVGFVLMGAVVGSVAQDVQDIFEDNEQLADMIRRMGGAASLVDSYIASTLGIFGIVAAGYMIQAIVRIRVEETGVRAEPVLAGAVSRWRWAGAHIAFALFGTIVVMVCGGLATGLAHGLRIGDVGGQLPKMVEASLVQLPAVWVLGAIAFAVVGLVPRYLGIAWGIFGTVFAIGWLGSALDLPDEVLDLSPFRHTPRFPAVDLSLPPLILLTVAAIALTVLGKLTLERRDIG
ncbi:MAG: ABC transporter permease [Actinobacteria bacterium]|nr:ABC transporter permease [Actinomycetota bacterium]